MANHEVSTLNMKSVLPDAVFRQAINQAYNAVLITTAELDQPGPQIVYANPALCDQTGYTEAELIGQTPRILQGARTDREVLERLRNTLSRGQFFEGETINYRKDGTPYLVHWNVTPVFDQDHEVTHYVSVQSDLTESVQSERFNRQIMSSLGEGVFCINSAGQLTLINQAALDLLGYSNEESLLGWDAHELIHGRYPDGRPYPKEECPICHVIETAKALYTWRDTFFRADGKPLAVESSATVIKGLADEANDVVVVFREITEQLAIEDELQKAAHYDRLTGAFNRHFFDKLVEQERARNARLGEHLSLLILDIDYFKSINDEHGHLVGDEVLKELASQIRERVRQTDILTRWGGEEFAILLPDTSFEGARELAESLRESVAAGEFAHGQCGLSVSLGGTEMHTDEKPAESFKRADEALYKAKASGRNQVCMA